MEYQADELADGSDNENNLEKGERTAERKMWKMKKVRLVNKGAMPKFNQPFSVPYTMVPWARSTGGQLGQ